MPKSNDIPGYCHHKPQNRAYVRLDGKQIYLGTFGSDDSKAKYERLISQWLRKAELTGSPDMPVKEVILHFWRYCKARYSKSGKGKYGSAGNWRPILKLMRKHFGKRPVSKFGPKAMKSLQAEMARLGHSRRYINDQLARGKQVFRWAVSEELIPVEVYQGLTTVSGLRRGQSEARELPPIKPVADEIVEATLPFLDQVVADMVCFQRLTGARPAEVCILRPCDIDRTDEIWVYTPESHKTEHHGKVRSIYIGPKAQDILRPYLLRPEATYCFEPRWKRSRKKYTTDSYRRAIHRACERRWKSLKKEWMAANPGGEFNIPLEKWSPNQLRHTAGTALRAEFGIETAQAVLGHSNIKTTEIYAARAEQKAIEAARKLG